MKTAKSKKKDNERSGPKVPVRGTWLNSCIEITGGVSTVHDDVWESVHLWTLSSRLRANVCRGRSGSVQTLWGFSSAGLSPPLAQYCTTESAPVRRLLAFDRGNEKLLSRLVVCACDGKVPAFNYTPIKKIWVGSVNNKPPPPTPRLKHLGRGHTCTNLSVASIHLPLTSILFRQSGK